MDESWDADFDGDIRVPETVRASSNSIRSETNAARELSSVTAQLKALLLRHYAQIPHEQLLQAVGIVHASTTQEDDELYASPAWETCKNQNLEVAGDSIEQVLTYAISVRDRIDALL